MHAFSMKQLRKPLCRYRVWPLQLSSVVQQGMSCANQLKMLWKHLWPHFFHPPLWYATLKAQDLRAHGLRLAEGKLCQRLHCYFIIAT